MANKPVTNHNVYILGAGFSADAGIPIVKDFLERMADSVDWLSASGMDEEVAAVRAVFDFRLRAAGAAYRSKLNVENIEELFSLAAASEGETLTDDVTRAIAATIDFARQTVQPPTCSVMIKELVDPDHSQSWNEKETKRQVYELYGEALSGGCSDSTDDALNTVITFNYDTVLEDALSSCKIPFQYGLSNESADYRDSSHCAAHDEDVRCLRIYKLHGSVNWGAPPNAEGKIQIHGQYKDVRAANEQALLIPPTWRKVFAGHVTDVWKKALNCLNSATRIVILGFSMPPTDTHFKYLLAAGLQPNISLRKLLFVNPGLRLELEGAILRNNLFSILREELEQRNIVRLVDMDTATFLLNGSNLRELRRRLSPPYFATYFRGYTFHPEL